MLMERFGALVSSTVRLRRARRLADDGQTVQAFALIAPLAKRGLPEAQLRVARAYLQGQGVPVNRAEAVRWTERAAQAGLTEAQTLIASLRLSERHAAVANATTVARNDKSETDRNTGNLETEVYWAKLAAEAGNADAKALLAYLHAAGPQEMRDPARSEVLYRESAASGSPQGALGHGLVLLRTANDEVSRCEAVSWIQKAAEADLPFAFYLLGLFHEQGFGVERSGPTAVKFYRRSAERGIYQGQLRFGLALIHGHSIPSNPIFGETWLRRAALAGEPNAAVAVGAIYATPSDLPPNYLEAAKWYQLATENGDRQSARILAALYLQGGNGLKKDRDEAVRWFYLAATQGDQAAWAELAALTLSGAGDPEIKVRVQQWYEAVAESGNLVAAFTLGMFFAAGVGMEPDEKQAAFWLRRAAEHVVEAQYRYGCMLYEGKGVAINYEESRAWLTRAATAGHLEAKVVLAEMLLNGRGGSRDSHTAFAMFSCAAEQGHVGAIFAVGIMLIGGNGVEQNHGEARNLFKLAAERGHAFAQLTLGRLLLHGISGEKNPMQACYWFDKARAQGLNEAVAELEALTNISSGPLAAGRMPAP
jgi:hypothetical protein